MSKRRGGSRSRHFARERKYLIGIDYGAEGSDATVVVSREEDGKITIVDVQRQPVSKDGWVSVNFSDAGESEP